jgi:Fe-S cluster assembly iron-binding protein IscA
MLAGATQNYYIAEDSGIYRVQVVDGGCSTVSDSVTITEDGTGSIAKPLVSKQPNVSEICSGGDVYYYVSNSSTDYTNAQYIWYTDTGIVKQGTDPYYYAKTVGVYFVEVIEGNCSSVSEKDTLKQGGTIEPAEISSISGSQIICGANGTVMLQLNNRSSYGNLNIQWYKNEQIVSGATSETYEVHVADTGVYRIYIQEGNCASFSDTMGVWFDATKAAIQPIVSLSSSTMEFCVDGSILLSVTNANDYSQNARYVWYQGSTIVQDSILPYYEARAVGIYSVQVSDGSCSSVSKADTIVVGTSMIEHPEIVSLPSSNTICGSDGIVILQLANASTYNNATIQWYKNNVIISGETKPIYKAQDSGVYRVHVTEGTCSAFSDPVDVKKNNNQIERPVIMNQSQTTQLCSGGSILLSIDNISDYSSNARYIWYKDDEIVQDSSIIYYEIKAIGEYFVQVIDGGCSSISNPNITVTSGGTIETPVITVLPNTNTICGNNGIVMLTLDNVNNYQNPTVQWYRNNVAIPGATEAIYIAHDSGLYRVRVVEGTCNAFSTVAVDIKKDMNKTIEEPVLVSSSPSLELCTGGSVLLSVSNTVDYGQGARYIWYKDMQKVQDSTISNYEVTNTGIYFVQIIDGTCSSISQLDTIVQGGTIIQPLVNTSPVSNTICGDSGVVILTLMNKTDYTSPVIQWYRNNVLIPGANHNIYVADTIGLYKVHVVDGNCSAFSDTVRLYKNNSVITKPAVSSSSPSGVICGPNGSIVLTVTNAGDYSASNTRYVWYQGTNIVQDSVISTYETLDSGAYFVHVIDGNCSAISTTIRLTKDANNFVTPLIATIPGSDDICGDTGVVFLYVTNANVYANPSYQWYNGSVLIQGATHSYYSATDSGDYRVLVTEGNCSGYSSIIHVSKTATNIDKPVIVSYPSSGRIYGGNMVKLYLQNGNMYTAPQYNWYIGDSLLTTDTICTTNVAGKYKLLLVDGNCAAWSNEIILVDTACNAPSFVSKNMSMCDSTLFDLALTIDTLSANSIMKYYADYLAQIELPSSIVGPHVTTTYYLRSMDTVTGCKSAIIPVIITVLSKPALPNPVADMIYVHGAAVSAYLFTGTTPGASYRWAWESGDSIIGLPKTGVNIIQGFTAINTDTVIKSATYMYTTDLSQGGQVCFAADTDYYSIIILPTPSVDIANQDQILCSGATMDTVSFTGRVANTVYTWTRISGSYLGFPATGTGDIQDSVLVNNGTMPITLVYQVVPTFTHRGVTSTGTPKNFTITINPDPVLSTVPDMSYCQGMVVPAYQFSGSTGLIYSWTKLSGDTIGLPDNGTGSLPSFTAKNTANTPKSAIYEVIAAYTSNGVTCSVRDTFSITINPFVTVDDVLDVELCNNDSLAIQFTGTGDEYKWEKVSGDIIGHLPFSGTGDIHIASITNSTQRTLSAVYKITAVYSHELGVCEGEYKYFTITVNPTPVLSSISHLGTVCSGSNISYTATTTIQGVSYSWTRVADTNINGGNTSSGQTPFVNESLVNTSDTIVRVTYEFSLTVNECTEIYPVTVDVSPEIQVSISYLNDVCIGESVAEIQYTASNSAAVYYTVTFSTDAQNVGFQSIGTPVLLVSSPITISVPAGAPSGIYTGTFHFHVGNCVKDTLFAIRISKQTRILAQPVSQLNLCDGESLITLRVQADGDNLIYQWYHEGVAISGANSDTYTEAFISELEGKYHVEVTGTCGVVVSDTIEVKASELVIEEKWDNVLYVGNPQGQYVGYQWYKNGVAITSGGIFQYYTDPSGFVGTYRVRAYFADGSYVESCSKILNRPKSHKMILFPNPVARGSEYKIELDDENLDNAIIEIYDAVGKLIETHVVTENTVELRAWYATGGYTIRIITEEHGIRIKKLIVK